ncbi:MAG TPA: AtpZ/AtpI family protein [Candidatus Saccharimonadales bacterium]|nr:AtpZ/AtpI family protein [Candidatus Saccharimonadales bacterium]
MSNSTTAPNATLSALGGRMTDKKSHNKSADGSGVIDADFANKSKTATGLFINMALTMAWQLALVVLVPIIIGVKIDKSAHTGSTFTYIGLGVAVLGSIAVMWRTLQVANKAPVPKLTEKQKRAVKKSYEDEDKDE